MQIDEIVNFFKLAQTTRSQPQYGYVVSGVQKAELSDLAQHHYLVTFIAWQLVRLIKNAGGKINGEQVLEVCLLHDLGELFGGDISLPYRLANPTAGKLAKAFEAENQKFLTKMLGDSAHIKQLFSEAESPHSDEGQVAKIADYIEVTHYKDYIGRRSEGDIRLVLGRMQAMASKVKNVKARKALSEFLEGWAETLAADTGGELFESFK